MDSFDQKTLEDLKTLKILKENGYLNERQYNKKVSELLAKSKPSIPSMTKNCPRCHKSSHIESKICISCGNQLETIRKEEYKSPSSPKLQNTTQMEDVKSLLEVDTVIDFYEEPFSTPPDRKDNIIVETFCDNTQDSKEKILQVTVLAHNQKASIVPANIIAVVDVSASMDQDLPLVKETIRTLVEELDETTNFSLITFSKDAKKVFPLAPMNSENKKTLLEKLASVKAETLTNLGDGMLMALAEFYKQKPDSSVRSILLFSDGRSNKGQYQEWKHLKSPIIQVLKELKKQKKTVSIHCLGYSADHEPVLLQNLASVASGMYYYVQSRDDISSSILTCCLSILTSIVQNVKLTLRAVGEYVIKDIRTSYFFAISDDLKAARVHFGTMANQELRSIQVVLFSPTGKLDSMEIQVDYDDVFYGVPQSVYSIHDEFKSQDVEVQLESLRYQSEQALHAAAEAISNGVSKEKIAEVVSGLMKVQGKIKQSKLYSHPHCTGMLFDIDKSLDILQKIQNGASDIASSLAVLCSLARSHQMQRATTVGQSYQIDSHKELLEKKITFKDALHKSIPDAEKLLQDVLATKENLRADGSAPLAERIEAKRKLKFGTIKQQNFKHLLNPGQKESIRTRLAQHKTLSKKDARVAVNQIDFKAMQMKKK